jgi:hypothetical protein
MSRRKIELRDEREALFVEQALAMFREMREVATEAPDGEVLNEAELLAMSRGRELIRKGLESVLQDQAGEVEKKGRRPEDVFAEEFARIAEASPRRSSRRPGK